MWASASQNDLQAPSEAGPVVVSGFSREMWTSVAQKDLSTSSEQIPEVHKSGHTPPLSGGDTKVLKRQFDVSAWQVQKNG